MYKGDPKNHEGAVVKAKKSQPSKTDFPKAHFEAQHTKPFSKFFQTHPITDIKFVLVYLF